MDREKNKRGHTRSRQGQKTPGLADAQKKQDIREAERLQERRAEEAVQQELGEQIQNILQEETRAVRVSGPEIPESEALEQKISKPRMSEPKTLELETSSQVQEIPSQDPSKREEGAGRRRRSARQKRGWRRLWKRFFLMLLLILFVAAAGCGLLGWKFYTICREEVEGLVADSTEADFLPGQASYFYDAAGNVLAKISGDEDSQYLPYEEIPQDAVNAFIAIEDRTFWENCGVDFKGILRVGINFILTKGEEVHGASTITQQLARNQYLTRDVSIKRKVKEILIAMDLTEKYSKEQIMEFYINDINYANTYYGLQAAAKGYFGKDADELSLSQIAYLCAIPNSPSYYNPYRHPDHALARRDKILGDMLTMGYITQEEHDAAVAEEITVTGNSYEMRNYETTYAIDCAVRWLMERDGFQFEYGFSSYDDYKAYQTAYEESYAAAKDELYTGGYRIYTSLDPAKQEILQSAVDQVLSFDEETADNGIYALQGAAVAVNNDTGLVEAIVGGRSQETSTYTLNRAFQSFRQPGSSIKPLIVYAPALENGYASFSSVKDISVDAAKEPKADVASLPGNWITLRQAVEKSRNGAAWWLFNEVTPEEGLSYLTQMRFDKIVPDDYNMAASLGGFTYGVTAEEMAGAFSALENGGVYREPDCIIRMENLAGENIYTGRESKEVYSRQTAAVMVDVMKGVISKGTARGMGWKSRIEAAGKTGTTNNSKDGWFCGMTPYYTVTVWVGYDTPRTLSSLYGSSYPASIWKQAMEGLTAGLPEAAFTAPGSEKEDIKKEGRGEYLEGYDDSHVLSPNYTVGDYRKDHALADEAQKYIDQMAGASPEEQERLRKKAESAINRIYGQTLKGQMKEVLDGAGKS
ncbi:MAG: transglycosylase domain-containing protein [Clostridium sp.]|nr:transglycosylase domain-containing protein [Clostridium sp.]